jgi:HAD superfamily hydrolase (TIGR01490 family)
MPAGDRHSPPAMRAGSWQGSRGDGVLGTPRPDDAAGDWHSPPGAAAFFDLDKTLMEGSSALHFGRAAYKAGQLSKRQMARDVAANVRFRLQGSTDAATDALRARVFESIAGRRVVDLARLTPDVLSGILPRVYPQMLDVAWRHQDAGRPVYIVTAASQEIAELLAHVLVFDGGIGARSEIRDGVYTGRPDGPFTYREGKAEAISQVAARDGIDLAESYAYSDSESDLPMLRAVGHPVAVNPDAELARVAREEGWEIMRFDRLGRRLRLAAGAVGIGLVGVGGGYLGPRLWRGSRA